MKYPLGCGCAGPKYVSMCSAHQEIARDDHQRRLKGAVTWLEMLTGELQRQRTLINRVDKTEDKGPLARYREERLALLEALMTFERPDSSI